MNTSIKDIGGKVLDKDDQILYATTHGTLQVGRVLEITDEGFIKVIGKGNRRELTIKAPDQQTFLKAKGYYIRLKKRSA